VVTALASGHRARGHDVAVAAILDSGAGEHPFVVQLRDEGVPVHSISLPNRAYRAERRAIGSICRSWQPQLVHTHGYRADILDSGVARRLGIPTVSTLHGFTSGDIKNRVYEFLQIVALRRVDAAIAVSRPIARLLERRGVGASRIHVIPNAWSPRSSPMTREAAREALGVPPAALRIAFVGRLSHEKGADVLLEAVARTDGRTTVSIIGSGPERSALEGTARALGVSGRVTWHGEIDGAARFLTAFDGIVLSSRTEGTPIILFEAIAAGVPVVASAVGGIPDVVTAREAYLVEPDDPVALASAIQQVADHPGEPSARAAAARRLLAERFQSGPWLERYEQVYETVLRFADGIADISRTAPPEAPAGNRAPDPP
jgi:glycosyltransferase involved in cell wall biosynthesis